MRKTGQSKRARVGGECTKKGEIRKEKGRGGKEGYQKKKKEGINKYLKQNKTRKPTLYMKLLRKYAIAA